MPCLHFFAPILYELSADVQHFRKRCLHLHSLMRLALLILRVLALSILGAGACEGYAREQRHHGDEEDDKFHF